MLAKASEELGLLVIDDTNLRRRYPNFPLLSDLRDKMLAQQEPAYKELDPFRLKYIDPFGRCRRRKGADSNLFCNVCYHGRQVSSGGAQQAAILIACVTVQSTRVNTNQYDEVQL